MKILIHFLLSVMIANPFQGAFARSPSTGLLDNYSFAKTVKAYERAKNLKQFLVDSKPLLPKNYYQFLSRKMGSDSGSEKPKVVSKGRNEFVFSHGGIYIKMKMVDPMNGIFHINNQVLKFSQDDSPQVIWQKIEVLFPKTAYQLQDFVVPKAYGFTVMLIWVLFAALMLGSAVTGYQCNGLKKVENACGKQKERVDNLERFLMPQTFAEKEVKEDCERESKNSEGNIVITKETCIRKEKIPNLRIVKPDKLDAYVEEKSGILAELNKAERNPKMNKWKKRITGPLCSTSIEKNKICIRSQRQALGQIKETPESILESSNVPESLSSEGNSKLKALEVIDQQPANQPASAN